MLQNGCLLAFVLDSLKLLLELLIFTLAAADLLLAHGLLLVDLLVVVLVLHAGILLKGAPLVLKLSDLFSKTISIHSEPLGIFICVRKLAAEIGQFITFLV